MERKRKIKNSMINTIVYTFILFMIISLLYIRYLILVNEGSAISIEVLKNRVIKEMVDKHDSINRKDSIILELEIEIDSLIINKT